MKTVAWRSLCYLMLEMIIHRYPSEFPLSNIRRAFLSVCPGDLLPYVWVKLFFLCSRFLHSPSKSVSFQSISAFLFAQHMWTITQFIFLIILKLCLVKKKCWKKRQKISFSHIWMTWKVQGKKHKGKFSF